jgi:hypothetical protein
VGVASGSGFTHKACAEELYRAQKRIVDIFVLDMMSILKI